jgi:hypothetical protein
MIMDIQDAELNEDVVREKKKKNKLPLSVKVPMLLSVLSYGLAVGIGYMVVENHRNIIETFTNLVYNQEIFPYSLRYMIVYLFVYILFAILMLTAKSYSRKRVGILMLGLYCLINSLLPVVDRLVIFDAYRRNNFYTAAAYELDSLITLSTNFFTVLSTMFMLVAIGRFGMCNVKKGESDDEDRSEKSDDKEEKVIFGDKEEDNGGFVKY